MRRVTLAVAALFMAAAWFVVTAPSGTAAGSLESGWWWQAESSSGAVPPPPTVPDGGLWISSNATGPQAVSAVRVPLDAGDAAPTLTLAVHQAAPPTAIDVAAYPTTSSWTPGPTQAWSSKPDYNPSGMAAVGKLSSDGKTITFDLSGLVTSDVLNVVLAPTPAAAPPPAPLPSPQPVPPTFDVTFEKPDANAFRVQPAPVAEVAPPEAAPAAAPSSDLGSVADTLGPALPTGLVAAPPLETPSVPPRAARPTVPFRTVPRRLLPVSTRRSFADSAAIAAMLGIVLLWLAREGGPGGRRPRFTLYDAPKQAQALAVTRPGSPPPLR